MHFGTGRGNRLGRQGGYVGGLRDWRRRGERVLREPSDLNQNTHDLFLPPKLSIRFCSREISFKFCLVASVQEVPCYFSAFPGSKRFPRASLSSVSLFSSLSVVVFGSCLRCRSGSTLMAQAYAMRFSQPCVLSVPVLSAPSRFLRFLPLFLLSSVSWPRCAARPTARHDTT